MTPRQNILETIKGEMVDCINVATIDTLDETEQFMNQLFKYAFYLKESVNELEPTEESDESLSKSYPINSGTLKQTLAHGFIVTENKTEIYVPEKIIRKHHLEHGDIIEYTPTYKQDPKKPTTYDYKLIEKRNKAQDSSKRVFKRAVVQKDQSDNFVVYQDTNQNLMTVDGEIKEYKLTQKECDVYDIQDNDVVDIAWYQTTFTRTARVIWKYSAEKETKSLEKTHFA